jgi:hemerythrin-like domain-containing protein
MPTRREVLGAALVIASCKGAAHPAEGHEPEVSPNEDLMREHGLLERILVVYDEAIVRIAQNRDVPLDAIARGADIVRRFVEDYHEKLEEEHVFPRVTATQGPLVATLRAQHAAGRTVTDAITKHAAGKDRKALATALAQFARMYRPHAAREDTVLFPAFRAAVSDHEYSELGEKFEDREHALFGKEGFEGMVAAVAQIEAVFDIADLAVFTPA